MDETSLVAERTVRSDEHVAGDRLTEDLDLEHVGDDLLRLPVNVRVDEGHVVVARDHVPERGQSLLDSLDGDRRGERVSQVLQLLVGRRVGKEESVSVS